MALLIDGYNLLNESGIFARRRGATGLRHSRNALLDFLSTALTAEQRRRTTIVFDAKDAPPGLPRTLQQEGITIRFAARNREADDLIEDLIRQDSAPRRLWVVSSDHRIQRAARRRKANAVDSDKWLAQLRRQMKGRNAPNGGEPDAAQASDSDSTAEVEAWLKCFTDVDEHESNSALPAAIDRTRKPATTDTPHDDLSNPFPAGYAEDLLKDDADLTDGPRKT